MFTGIVEEVATVMEVDAVGDKRRIRIEAPVCTADLVPGASIAVNGACQTVVELEGSSFLVEAIATTLGRTTLGALRSGSRVNLERPLALGARVGGHLVQGHADGIGRVQRRSVEGEHAVMEVRVPHEVAAVSVLHGSITLDGVSLTINALPGDDRIQVALIPYTLEHTTLRDLGPGSEVNVEGDMVGKMLARYAQQWLSARGES